MGSVTIPEAFKARIKSIFDVDGELWLRDLPQITEEYLSRWQLKIVGSFDDLSFNFVVPVESSDGTPAVLKLGLHSHGRLREIAALNHYDGCGAIKVLRFDSKTGVCLLERASPGHTLKNMYLENGEAEANQIACSIISQLQSGPPPKDLSPFKNVSEWGKGFQKFLESKTKLSEQLSTDIKRADEVFHQLLNSTKKITVLHADLHHSNILSSNRNSYLAIDPKGMCGDLAYELGAWIRNPMPEILKSSDIEHLLGNRINTMSDSLRFDRERVWGWAYSQAWLAVIWAIEDKSPEYNSWLAVARKLSAMNKFSV